MSVYFLSGKPGDGKSLSGVMEIIEELRTSEREIVTNLSLDLPELAQYMHDKYGQAYRVHERVRLLSAEETLVFWCYAGPGRCVDEDKKKVWRTPKGNRELSVTDLSFRESSEDPGVFYVLDEAHIPFSARRWQANGTDGFFYLSQHRKFRDDVLLITQYVSNVDKQFRSVAHSYRYVRNGYKRNLPLLGGMFRSRGVFTLKEYSEERTSHSEPERVVTWKMDLRICKCYATLGGVGVAARSGAEETKKRGLPFWTLAIPMVAIGVLLMYAPRLVGKIAGSALRSGQKAVASTVVPVSAATNSIGMTNHVAKFASGGSGSEAGPGSDVFPSERVTGFARVNGVWCAYLSSGVCLWESSGVEFLRNPVGQLFAVRSAGRMYVQSDAKKEQAYVPAPRRGG